MSDVVIDTDVASRLQKGTEPVWVRSHVVGSRTWLSFVTVGELWKWAEVRRWGESKRSQLAAWVNARPYVPCDREVARVWGRLSANAQQRGRPRPQNDTWVAACCLHLELPLVTLNRRDFADFAEFEGLVLLGDDG